MRDTRRASVRTAPIDERLQVVIVVGDHDDSRAVQAAIPEALWRRDRLGTDWTAEDYFREGLLQQTQSSVGAIDWVAIAAQMNDSAFKLPDRDYPVHPDEARSIVRSWEGSSRRKRLASFMPESVEMEWKGPVETVQIALNHTAPDDYVLPYC
jgi:hypothetical protein